MNVLLLNALPGAAMSSSFFAGCRRPPHECKSPCSLIRSAERPTPAYILSCASRGGHAGLSGIIIVNCGLIACDNVNRSRKAKPRLVNRR